MHANAPEHGERLRGRLREAFPTLDPDLGELGPVVGTYTGSGALGVALMTAAG
jgi:fatty acid-binding protein DegV